MKEFLEGFKNIFFKLFSLRPDPDMLTSLGEFFAIAVISVSLVGLILVILFVLRMFN